MLALLIAQEELQRESFGFDFGKSMSDEERVDYIRVNVLALTDELHEALGEVGWKPWATSRHINTNAYFGELIDALHFLMNLLLATGLEVDDLAEQLSERYFHKRAINARRQADGYDGISGKCPGCGRDINETSLEERLVYDVQETICPCGTILWSQAVGA